MSRSAFEAWCRSEGIPWPGTESSLGKAWQAARNAALEEAAQKFEALAAEHAQRFPVEGDIETQVRRMSLQADLRMCAYQARAMKEQPDKPLDNAAP